MIWTIFQIVKPLLNITASDVIRIYSWAVETRYNTGQGGCDYRYQKLPSRRSLKSVNGKSKCRPQAVHMEMSLFDTVPFSVRFLLRLSKCYKHLLKGILKPAAGTLPLIFYNMFNLQDGGHFNFPGCDTVLPYTLLELFRPNVFYPYL